MNVTASLTNAQRAVAFAAEVRSHLSDLPGEELDDLLDGLGADLEERLNDGDELGDSAGYAEELRQAAGLPPRDPRGARRATIGERTAAARARVALWLDETPARRGLRDFALSVRPLWWVLRAIIGAWTALLLLGHPLINGLPLSFWAIALTLALTVLSVQWGRGRWLPNAWLRGLRTAANVAAVLLLIPFAFANWANLSTPRVDYIYEELDAQGLRSNGEQVTNIFAYDCEGNPLDSVRLFDQRGNPLSTLGQEDSEPPQGWDENGAMSFEHDFNPLAKTAEAWNVFPLSEARFNYSGKPGKMGPAKPPSGYLPPLSRDCPIQPQAPGEAAGTTGAASSEGNTEPEEAAKP